MKLGLIFAVVLVLGVGFLESVKGECSERDDCCHTGGTCGNAVFDNCETNWNYRIRCNPTYKVCCEGKGKPDTTTTTKATTQAPTQATSTTPKPAVTTGTATTPTATGSTGTPTEGPVANTTTTTEKPAPSTTSRAPGSKKCGKVPVDGDYIVGGNEAQPHSWPWAVSLYLDYFGWGDWKHHCTGSLVDNQFVVTAAHCIAKSGISTPNSFKVVLGGHDQSVVNGNEIVATIDRWIVHEDYSTSIKGSPNDIVLLKLSEPVQLNRNVQPVCLPEPQHTFMPGDKCFILGWGETLGTSVMGRLNEVQINITTNADCDYYWEKGSGRVNLIKDSHICVGMGVPGACRGDSGGPLVCDKAGYWTLAGCTSFGAAGCQEPEAPNVYTRITSFMPWIQQNIANNS